MDSINTGGKEQKITRAHAVFFTCAMKSYKSGEEVKLHLFLTSALGGGEWSAIHPGRFNPGEKAPDTK